MTTDLMLRGKWTLRAHGRTLVLKKRTNEKTSHVLMKAFLFCLYLPRYPELTVEVRIGDRYKPDLVALDSSGAPTFWGESGQVGGRKLDTLLRRYPGTHFAIAKWAVSITPHVRAIKNAVRGSARQAPVDLIVFPEDGAERFIDEDGVIDVRFDDLSWTQFEA